MNNESNQDEPHHLVSTTYEDEDEVIHSPTSVTDEEGHPIGRHVSSPILQPFHEIKWNRLRQDYNDQYLEIFKHALELPNGEHANLASTQLGAVCWLPSEKARLYEALERKGRRDLKAITQLVKTKSETEVNAYLSWLRQEETDRQLFEAQTKNISHIDIPAAIEIGSECETVLDKAAAALSAFQEHFDFAAGQRSHRVWLIDRQTASELDKAADEIELSDNPSEGVDEEPQPLADSAQFFHTSTFLKLSESFYMNQGSGETWRDLGEASERPAMTMDVLTEFYEIIVSYLRRLIQSIIFIAKSRIRLTSTISYSTLHTVRQEDVIAALDILNVKNDLWGYWIRMPRRNNLLVVHKNSVKHFNPDAVLNYDKVEAALSERKRGRSLSARSELFEETGRSGSPFSEEAEGDKDTVLPGYMDDAFGTELDIGVGASAEGMRDSEADEEMSFSNGDEIDSTHIDSPPAVPHRTSKRKSTLVMEDETDEYMEHLDQKARVQEESRLLQLLGLEPENVMKGEKMEVSRKRPRVLRKTIAEAKGWSAAYQSEWELYKEPVQFSNLQTQDASHNEVELE